MPQVDNVRVFLHAGLSNALDGSEDHLMASDLKEIWDGLGMADWRHQYVRQHPRKVPPLEILKSLQTIDWDDYEPSESEVGHKFWVGGLQFPLDRAKRKTTTTSQTRERLPVRKNQILKSPRPQKRWAKRQTSYTLGPYPWRVCVCNSMVGETLCATGAPGSPRLKAHLQRYLRLKDGENAKRCLLTPSSPSVASVHASDASPASVAASPEPAPKRPCLTPPPSPPAAPDDQEASPAAALQRAVALGLRPRAL